MPRRWSLRTSLGLGLVALLLVACQPGVPPAQAGNRFPADPPAACLNPGGVDRRFAYIDEREKANDVVAAQAMLDLLALDCDATVRDKARERLARLPRASALGGKANCPGQEVWVKRFEFETAFEAAGDLTAARIVLENALGDCDPDVRQTALERLTTLKSPNTGSCPPLSVWDQRFAYADLLAERKEFDTARTLLAGGIADCNADVRGKSLQRLNALLALATAQPATYCPKLDVWDERFGYAKKLDESGDIAGVRALLMPGLADCNADVRAKALARLNGLKPPPPPLPLVTPPPGTTATAQASSATCKDADLLPVWKARFAYGSDLGAAGDVAGERSLLLPALSDTDSNVRECALKKLSATVSKPHWWASPFGYAGQFFLTLGQLLIGLAIAYPVIFLIWGAALVINRHYVSVDPLNVAGDGFKGDSFVSIVTHLSLLMDEMKWIADPERQFGVSTQQSSRPRVATGEITKDAGAAMSAAEAIAGDAAGKLMAILFGVLRQPRYRCVGTVNLGSAEAQIVILLQRRRLVRRWRIFAYWWPYAPVIGHWQLSVPLTDLSAKLRQVGFEVLLMVAHDLRPLRTR